MYEAHLTSKRHIKLSSRERGSNESQNIDSSNSVNVKLLHLFAPRRSSTALLTHLVSSLLRNLSGTLNETKSNVERRFSLTSRERQAELIEKPSVAASPVNVTENTVFEEVEEEHIYNPLKLPLGWDGKPIPYWLYKLHGLGVEYRCEICSDYVYMGRYNIG